MEVLTTSSGRPTRHKVTEFPFIRRLFGPQNRPRRCAEEENTCF
jgi:hypothetical protein